LESIHDGRNVYYQVIAGFSQGKAVISESGSTLFAGIIITGNMNEKSVTYSIKIPWRELNTRGTKLPFIRAGIMLQDDDGKGAEGEMNWTPASIPGTVQFSRKFISRYFGDILFDNSED
jgi:hypothetical protein